MSDVLGSVVEGSGGGCFRAGTLVQLEGGKSIPIEAVAVGDKVLSFDESGRIHSGTVTVVHYHADPQPVMRVKFWRGEICITPNHWVLNQYENFAEIGKLTTHDALMDGMGHLRPIIGSEGIGSEPVWNLTVEPHHTFIANGICVHNGGHRARHPEIEGSGGGGGKGGGSSRAAIEADDSLQSKASLGIIDLLGEGEIGGLVDGAKSIFLNDTPLMNPDGTYNFSDVVWEQRTGTQHQLPITKSSAFDAVSTPVAVGVQLKHIQPYSITVQNPLANQVMIIMAVQQLMSQDKTNGDISGASVTYTVEISIDGGAFATVISPTIKGKTRSRYQRAHIIDIPPGDLRIIRLTRDTADSTSSALTNDLYFDSYVERVTTILNYPNSALVAVTVNAAQFTSAPKRSYLVDGLYIRLPSNYDPVTRTYAGVWDGTLNKIAASCNPAWILYDLLTTARYGLGDHVGDIRIDKAALYQIGRYCDELVPNGLGGFEPRFSANMVINTLSDAYKLISQITSIFRGMGFWGGSNVGFMYDAPRDPAMIYNQANVIDGAFAYVGSSRKNRHSVALITWSDPAEVYKQKVEYVEDAELIGKFGVRKMDMIAFGCTSRAQAHRLGRWILYTEKYESQLVTFKVGIDSAMVLPGEVVLIHDDHKAGKRMGGRAKGATLNSLTLDAPVVLAASSGVLVLVRLPDGTFAERPALEGAGEHSTLTWVNPLPEVPVSNAIYIVSEPNLVPLLARVVSVAQGDKPGTFAISALEHNPSKYNAIENNYRLEEMNVSVIDPRAASAPTNLAIVEEQYEIYQGTMGVKLAVSWSGTMPSYEVSYRCLSSSDPAYTVITTSYSSIEVDVVRKGDYEFSVRGVNAFGVKSATPATAVLLGTGTVTQPPMLTGINLSAALDAIVFQCDYPADITASGVLIHVGGTADFTPDATTLYYKGTDSQCVITNHPSGASFVVGEHVFIKAAGYATLSADPINWSGSIEVVVPNNVLAASILTLSTSSTVFQVKKDGSNSPNSITLSAICSGGLTGTAEFSVSAIDATLTGTGNTRTIDLAGMSNNDHVTVTAAITDGTGTYQDQVTIIKVREGVDSVSMSLSNEAVTLAAANDTNGTVVDYAPAQTGARVFIGAIDDTANWTLSKADSAGVTTSVVLGQVRVDSMNLDSAYTDITMTPGPTRSMYSPITKRFSMSKSRAGAAGTDGMIYTVNVESTQGSIFRVGQSEATELIARVFRNGVDVTADIPASQFSWRRVSFVPQPYPNDDATWNALYASGHKSVSVTTDSIMAKATFHCDIIETV